MPGIHGLRPNNAPIEQNLPVPNVQQPHRASGLSKAARIALGFATIGLSELVIWCRRSSETAPARNLNPQLPALSASEKRANDDLAAIFERRCVPHKYVEAAALASADLKRRLPVTELTDGARGQVVEAIRSAGVKVTPDLLASMMKEAVLSDYLCSHVFTGMVREAAAPFAETLGVDPATAAPGAVALATKSLEVKALAQNVNFKNPEELEAFKQRVMPLVKDQVSTWVTVCGRIKEVQAKARARLLAATGLEDNEKFAQSIRPFLEKLESTLRTAQAGVPADPETGLQGMNELPAIVERIRAEGEALINEKLSIVGLIRENDFSPAVQKEWARQALTGGVFFNPMAARNALGVAGSLATGPEAQRLSDVLSATPVDKAAVKTALVNLLVKARQDLAALAASPADKQKYEGSVLREAGVLVFGAVLDRNETLRALFHEKRELLAEVQEELAASADADEFCVAQSAFETVHSQEISALCRANHEHRLDLKQRNEVFKALQKAIAGRGTVPPQFLPALESAMTRLRERYGEAVIPLNADPMTLDIAFSARSTIRKLAGDEATPERIEEVFVQGVVESFTSKTIEDWLGESIAQRGIHQLQIDDEEEQNALIRMMVLQIRRHSPRIGELFAGIRRPEDVGAIEGEVRGILSDYAARYAAFDQRAVAFIEETHQQIAAASGFDLAFVKRSADLSSLKARLDIERKDIARDPHTGLPDEASEDRIFAEVRTLRDEMVRRYREAFPHVERLDIPASVKRDWRSAIVTDRKLFLSSERIDAMVNIARSLPTEELEAALAAEPADPVTLCNALRRFIDVMDRGVVAHTDPMDGADMFTPMRDNIMTLFAAEHPRLVEALIRQKNMVAYTLRALEKGKIGLGADDGQFLKSVLEVMSVEALRPVIQIVNSDRNASLVWTGFV